jgi:hypothetical protein
VKEQLFLSWGADWVEVQSREVGGWLVTTRQQGACGGAIGDRATTTPQPATGQSLSVRTLREEPSGVRKSVRTCLSRCELGDGLSALRNGVLRKLSWEDEAHCCLDLARGDGGLLVVASQVLGLGGNLVKDVL